MKYSLDEILSVCEGSHISGPKSNDLLAISIDSRKIYAQQGLCFVALTGVNFDGHNFIHEAYKKGVRFFIISTAIPGLDQFRDADFVLVSDTVSALQNIAKHHREQFTFPVIGITGSNGKTTIKEWLYQCLSKSHSVVKTPKSYNSQIGVPLSIFQMNESHEFGIFEAGISRPDEMGKLGRIIQPNVGVFVNIGNAHDAFFADKKEKAAEKRKLFETCSALIYNADDQLVSDSLNDFNGEHFSWSLNNCGYLNFNLTISEEYSTVETNGKEIRIPFSDEASIQNCLHLIATLMYFKISEYEIQKMCASLQHIAMRLERVEGLRNSLFISDVYNSDLTSFEAALELLNNDATRPIKSLVLSDIQNTGHHPLELCKKINAFAKNIALDTVHLIGNDAKLYRDAFKKSSVRLYANTATFLTETNSGDFQDNTVLIKGSRSFKLERIIHKYQKQTHRSVLEVNLSSLSENLNFYRSKLKENVRLCAMVKAFSYGSGSHEIAEVLEKNNVDYLAVAYVDEGIALREKNIGLPIIVMNPENPQPAQLIEFNLEPAVYSMESLNHYKNFAHDLKIHLKLDSGMHRLGFLAEEMTALNSILTANRFNVVSVFTHLAASNDFAHDSFTLEQIEKFNKMADSLSLEQSFRHALNTAGISRFADYQMGMVRLGIGLYGCTQVESEKPFLRPALRLRSSISQIKQVKKGESIGYSRNFLADRAYKIGIVPIGYADGIHRCFGNGKGSVVVNQITVKTIGSISMDMCMIDLSEVNCAIGDDVEFFGPMKDIDETASEMSTIAYEVLANVSQRVKRVFYFD